MLGARVEERLVRHAGSFQRRLIRRPHAIDALVVLRVLDEQRRLDPRHRGRLRRRAVVRHAGLQIRAHRRSEVIHHATAVAEPGRAELAGGKLVGLQKPRAVEEIRAQLRLVEVALQRAAVVVVARIAADRKQAVRRERKKALDRGAAGDVLDVRIEAAVFVDDDHRRKRPHAHGLHEIAAHGARIAAGRRIVHVLGLDARVGKRDGLRFGIARQKRLRHDEAPRAERPGALEELAPVDAAVAVLVIQIEHALVDLDLANCAMRALLRCSGRKLRGSDRCVHTVSLARSCALRQV